MEIVCERCCGLDMHKRTFGTMTVDILALLEG